MSLIMTPDELAARKRRNLWIALAIVGFVVLVFLVTMTRVGEGIAAGGAS